MTASFPVTTTVSGNIQGMSAANYRHIFSPTMVNELTFGYASTKGPISFSGNSLSSSSAAHMVLPRAS